MHNSRITEQLIALAEHPLIRTLSFGLLLIFFLILYKFYGGDFDIWFHLAYGKHFVTNLTWTINHAMFSWTPANPDWAYVTWVGSSLLYIVYTIGGVSGFVALQYGIFLIILLIYYRYLRQTEAPWDFFHSACIVLMLIALNSAAILIKPEMFTTLFFAVSVFLFIWVKTTGHYRLFYWYPAIFLVWVNTHGGFIFGLFLLFSLIVLEAINQRFVKKALLTPAAFRALLLSALCSLVLLLVNPLGINYFIQLARDLFLNEYMDYAKGLLAYASLWKYVFPLEEFAPRFTYTALSMLLMMIALVSLAIIAYKRAHFLDMPLCAMNVLFFLMAMSVSRMIIFFPLLWLFTIPYIIHQGRLADVQRQILPLALIVFIGFGSSSAYNKLSYSLSSFWVNPPLNEWVPVDEVTYIKEHRLPGPLFNDYSTGPYLIWSLYPEQKVFIDARYGPYSPEVRQDWFTIHTYMTQEGLKQFRQRYPFKTACIHHHYSNIIHWLLASREWHLVYFGKVAAVLVHTSVLEERGHQALAVDLSADRFTNVSDPVILNRLFQVYIMITGSDTNAEKIRSIYKENVDTLFDLKDIHLMTMTKDLETRKTIKKRLKQ